MTLLDALAPFRGRFAGRLKAAASLDFVALGGIFAGALLVYCLGHGLLSAEPVAPGRSLTWSLAHGAGLASLLAAAAWARRRRPGLILPLALSVGLGASSGTMALAGFLVLGAPVWPDYVAVSVYVGTAAGLAWLVAGGVGECRPLVVDFGCSRERISVSRIVAAHGARNYAELRLVQDDRVGLVRCTLAALEADTHRNLVRVQRSWLVNPTHVRRVCQGQRGTLILEMMDGLEVPVSAAYAEFVLADPRFVPGSVSSSQVTGRTPG